MLLYTAGSLARSSAKDSSSNLLKTAVPRSCAEQAEVAGPYAGWECGMWESLNVI